MLRFLTSSYTKCTMLGSLTTFDHQLYNVTSLKTPFRLLILFIYNLTHVTTFTHNYFLHCVTFTQLTILHANIPFSPSLHNTLQIKPSHFETLTENLLREFAS
jgi:hypothetical protein